MATWCESNAGAGPLKQVAVLLLLLLLPILLHPGCRGATQAGPTTPLVGGPSPQAGSAPALAIDLTDIAALIKSTPPTRERLEAYLKAYPAFEKAAAALPPQVAQAPQGKNPIERFAAVVASPPAGATLTPAVQRAGVKPEDFYATHVIMQTYLIVKEAQKQGVSFEKDAAQMKAKVEALRKQVQQRLTEGNVTVQQRQQLSQDLQQGEALVRETESRARLEQAVGTLTPEQTKLLGEYSERLKQAAAPAPQQPPKGK